jgi:hypothetical protein
MTCHLPRNLANEACSMVDDDIDMTCNESLANGPMGPFDDACLSCGQRRYLEYIMESLAWDPPNETPTIWTNTFAKLTLYTFLERATVMNLPRSTYVCALVFMDRYVNVTMSSWSRNNVVLMYCVALMLAHKMGDDVDLWSSESFAQLGCIDIKRMTKLEVHFLATIQWNLYIDTNLYNLYNDQITKLAAQCVETWP